MVKAFQFYLPKPYFSYAKSMTKLGVPLISKLKVKKPILKGVLVLVLVN